MQLDGSRAAGYPDAEPLMEHFSHDLAGHQAEKEGCQADIHDSFNLGVMIIMPHDSISSCFCILPFFGYRLSLRI